MGLILSARCGRCDFARTDLRLGASMEQMSGEHRSGVHLHRCRACADLAQVELALGEKPGERRCDRCEAPLELAGTELRIVRMQGLALEGHACPRCGEDQLSFREEGRFL
jgi:hypothetical protein